jgi:hypothetical protein
MFTLFTADNHARNIHIHTIETDRIKAYLTQHFQEFGNSRHVLANLNEALWFDGDEGYRKYFVRMR